MRRGPASRGRAGATRADLFSPKLSDESAKRLPALFEVAELVVARARGREQHDVTRLGVSCRSPHGGCKIAGPAERPPCTGQRRRAVFGRLADEVDRTHGCGQLFGKLVERFALQRAAEYQPKRLTRVGGDAAPRRGGIRRLRGVCEADTV